MKSKRNNKRKVLHVSLADFMKANRRAARMEDIEAHGKPTVFRSKIMTSKKVYNRKRLSRIDLQDNLQ